MCRFCSLRYRVILRFKTSFVCRNFLMEPLTNNFIYNPMLEITRINVLNSKTILSRVLWLTVFNSSNSALNIWFPQRFLYFPFFLLLILCILHKTEINKNTKTVFRKTLKKTYCALSTELNATNSMSLAKILFQTKKFEFEKYKFQNTRVTVYF